MDTLRLANHWAMAFIVGLIVLMLAIFGAGVLVGAYAQSPIEWREAVNPTAIADQNRRYDGNSQRDPANIHLPDPRLTPGKVRALSTEQVCTIKWGRDRRHVTDDMRREVFRRYGIDNCLGCEMDHLIPRELGGSDHADNLFCQCPYTGSGWTARAKDRLENRLHKEVCLGNLRLREAQRLISHDWTLAYRRYFGEPK